MVNNIRYIIYIFFKFKSLNKMIKIVNICAIFNLKYFNTS